MKRSKKETPDFETTTRSPEDTQKIGELIGKILHPGDVLALIGELGSGKTTLIQGLARGMGLDKVSVKSPTFILLREYPGKTALIHIDGYRLEGDSQAIQLDLEWVFSPKKVTVIEWADRLSGCLPEDYLEIRMAHKSSHQRSIAIVSHGNRSGELAKAIASTVHSRQSTDEAEENDAAKSAPDAQ
jgi:tRNA threonylcarbamoyladenosine biosynthesis protein TsaE